MVELTARVALESMMAATADDATPIIRRLARIQARTVLDQMKATPDAAASEVDDPDHQYAVVSSNYSRPFLVGAYPTLDAALLAQDGEPDRWHIYRRLPAAPDAADSNAKPSDSVEIVGTMG